MTAPVDSARPFKGKITAQGTEISVLSHGNDNDFISLTDIARYKNAEYPSDVIQNWMRNRSTVEFIGLWERIHNPDFNYLTFEVIDRDAGRNALYISKGLTQPDRITELNRLARMQLAAITGTRDVKKLKAMESENRKS